MDKQKKLADPAAREIGLRIAQRRIDLKMSQKELSIQADVPYQTISLIENGRRMPDTNTLIKLAQGLQAPLSALQPKSLDQYSKIPTDILLLCDQLKNLRPEHQKIMVKMINAQIDALTQNFTPT